ncbi:MAG: dipeptide ABC transporter ATP-binding protein [Candidatus Poribacteria bacterium]|nr:dipeptide ABC transporter ATP-binding protein [Candidatus Poribacteria bacterium]
METIADTLCDAGFTQTYKDKKCTMTNLRPDLSPVASELTERHRETKWNDAQVPIVKNTKLLQVNDLRKYFPIQKGILQRTVGYVKAVDGISFDVNRGETLGLVGESGCGKTTAGRCLLRLIPPTSGSFIFGEEQVDLAKLTHREMQPFRKRIQMIFQDPHASLNPRMTVADIVGEPMHVNRTEKGTALQDRIVALLESVGLRSQDMRRYPHAFSGGQRQRIGIARALALQPELIVADEPVSALDVSVQAQILNLLAELREEFNLSYIFIAHDLSVVEHISDRVAVMYLGKIVEISDAETLYESPKHPYTEALISAVPLPDPNAQREREHIRLEGDVPDPSQPPTGCYFHPRCRYATDICKQETPELRQVAQDVQVACHHSDTLELQGV